MIRVFISQPTRDKTNEQIKTERKRALDEIKTLYPNEEIEEIQSLKMPLTIQHLFGI